MSMSIAWARGIVVNAESVGGVSVKLKDWDHYSIEYVRVLKNSLFCSHWSQYFQVYLVKILFLEFEIVHQVLKISKKVEGVFDL